MPAVTGCGAMTCYDCPMADPDLAAQPAASALSAMYFIASI